MPQRKVWTQEQDKILRLLREERAERKWANIARIMQAEFGVCGRTGKQCRQRYHNHLDSSIINSQWTAEEEQILYQMHEQIGNKWSVISQKLPGRSDNCVKNHFYSKLRKAVRRLNKLITDYFSTQHKFIKESVLSKIVKTTESKFKNNSKIDEELADFCNDIKNRLFRFQLRGGQDIEDIDFGKKIIVDIEAFDRDYKKGYKGMKNQFEYQYKSYLKPPPKTLKKNSSTQSCSSMKSDDSSSYLSSMSSNSCFSSSDLSEFQPQIVQKKVKKLNNSKSLGTTSGRNSLEISKSQKIEEKLQNQDFYQKQQMENKNILKPHTFLMQHNDLIMQDSEFYERNNNLREMEYSNMNMIYDETPQIGSILAPREMYAPFYLFQKEQDNQEIEYRSQSDKMDIQ